MVMKKPEMNINGHDIIEWFEVEGLTPKETKEAYSEMIDALILARGALIGAGFTHEGLVLNDIDKALKKAGVEL